MKTKKTVSEITKLAIKTYLERCEKYKGSYFWGNFGNAQQRNWREAQAEFTYDGDGISLEFRASFSRNNCYLTKNVFIDGVKTNAKALHKFINEGN